MRKRCLMLMVLLFLMSVWIMGCQPSQTVTPIEQGVITPSSVDEPSSKGDIPTITVETEQPIDALESAPPEAASTAELLVSELVGLDLRDFFEESNRILILRSPETVLGLGLTDFYGMTEVQLDDISDSYQHETYELIAAILRLLEGYDRSELSPEDQISYDIYRWYLSDRLASREFMYHDYPATYYPITAIQEGLLHFFTDIHPVRDMQDAQDYVTRLYQVGDKIDQLIEGLEYRDKAGIQPPEFAIQWAVNGSLGQFIDASARKNRLYTALKEKIDPQSWGTPEGRQLLLEDAERAINDVVLPAYRRLHAYLSDLQVYEGGDAGVWRLPQGEAYYDYLLHHFTTTDISEGEIHQLGLAELERIHGEMRKVFDELGYPQDISIVEAYNLVAEKGGHISGKDVIKTYEKLITEADQNLEAAFDIRSKAGVVVIPDTFGDFYISGSFDGLRPGAFYAGVSGSGKEYYAMPTLAYHETIPGHHFQISLAMEMKDLPSFRRGLGIDAFTEGWALYAENLVWELGWYEGDPYGFLGFLQGQALRAARLVVDTGLHAKGWTFDQAQDFFTENTGFEVGDNLNPQQQIARYLVWPGQSVSYYVGFQKILELRQHAIDELGDAFDLKAFHRVVLSNGSMPLELLEQVVDQYIAGEITP